MYKVTVKAINPPRMPEERELPGETLAGMPQVAPTESAVKTAVEKDTLR